MPDINSDDGTSSTAPSEDEDEIVSLADTTLQRRGGELVAERVYVEELDGSVKAKPMVRDERKYYVEEINDPEVDRDEISDGELADLFDEKIKQPDLTEHELCDDSVTEEFVSEGLTSTGEEGYYIAILLVSGEDDMVRRMRGEYEPDEIDRLARAEAALEDHRQQNGADDKRVESAQGNRRGRPD